MMHKICVFIFTFFCLYHNSHGQTNEREEYEFLLSEAALFEKYAPAASPYLALLDSAKHYAFNGEYIIASVFLEEFLKQQNTNQSTAQNPALTFSPPKSFELIVSSGIDFNRNEFELGYAETDSIIHEEVFKPYINVRLSRMFSAFRIKDFKTDLEVRYDKENLLGSLETSGTISNGSAFSNFSLGLNYDKNTVYPDFSFIEGYSRQRMTWLLSKSWELRLNNLIRYKSYHSQSPSAPDFFKDLFELEMNGYEIFPGWLRFAYLCDFNESINQQNNDYIEQSVVTAGEIQPAKQLKTNFGIDFQYNRFTFLLEDSLFNNQSRNVFFEIQNKFLLGSSSAMHLDYQGKYKNYIRKTEQEPDYYQQEINAALRHSLNNFTIEAGYQFEQQRHFSFKNANLSYIKEQNYYGNGLLIGIDYSKLPAYLFSINGSYTWRRYPDANDEVLSVYADRNVLTLHLFVQMPVFRNVYLNVYVSYDSDQDIDVEENKTHSSFFSAEIQYKF